MVDRNGDAIMGRAFEVRKAAMARTSAAKTKLYSKYGKEILIAAKTGVPDPEMNLSLKRVIERAKKAQVPGDIIKRAIDKAQSGASEDYSSVTYEGFGPGAATIIVECLTDNLNRSVSEVRTAFNKNHTKFGVSGSVSHGYDHVSLLVVSGVDEDQVLEALIVGEVNVRNIESDGDQVTITGEPQDLYAMKSALESLEGINVEMEEVTWIPMDNAYVELDSEDDEVFQRLLQLLDDLDDVQNVYHNVAAKE
jgi:YebC/PmpR family DNA-binding regulatory protein